MANFRLIPRRSVLNLGKMDQNEVFFTFPELKMGETPRANDKTSYDMGVFPHVGKR